MISAMSRHFGLLDSNHRTPKEFQLMRDISKYRQKLEHEKRQKLKMEKEKQQYEIFYKYLLPRVSGSIMKDFINRF